MILAGVPVVIRGASHDPQEPSRPPYTANCSRRSMQSSQAVKLPNTSITVARAPIVCRCSCQISWLILKLGRSSNSHPARTIRTPLFFQFD